MDLGPRRATRFRHVRTGVAGGTRATARLMLTQTFTPPTISACPTHGTGPTHGPTPCQHLPRSSRPLYRAFGSSHNVQIIPGCPNPERRQRKVATSIGPGRGERPGGNKL